MTYNVFGETLNLTQSIIKHSVKQQKQQRYELVTSCVQGESIRRQVNWSRLVCPGRVHKTTSELVTC